MTLYQIKPFLRLPLRPTVFWLYRHRATANRTTLIVLALSFLTGLPLVLTAQSILFLLLPIMLFIRMTFSVLDGTLVREYNQKTYLGATLNGIDDVIPDTTFYLPLLFLSEDNTSFVILMLFYAVLTEFCSLLAQTINGIRNYADPFGRSDRALVFGLWRLAIAIYPQWMQWDNFLWSIVSILLLQTAINHCRSVLLTSTEG